MLSKVKAVVILVIFLTINFFLLISKISVGPPQQKGILSPIAESSQSSVKTSNALGIHASSKITKITPVPGKEIVNILFLGLDGRKGDKRPRCDAIHMITLDFKDNNITITSLPRGTRVNLPEVSSNSAYLGNSCHIKGIDFARSIIEKISGKKADYVVKLGFSQAMGIFRLLKLPTTTTLMSLRNRRYGIGDYQRSYNQALFIKDLISSYTTTIYKLPKPIKYLVFRLIDTDMDFETASSLIEEIYQNKIYKNTARIKLITKPEYRYKRKQIHLLGISLASLDDLEKDEDFIKYQNRVVNYLSNLTKRAQNYLSAGKQLLAYKLIKVPFSQKIWLQIEDGKTRNKLHFDMLKAYVLSAPNTINKNSLILDFILEMEIEKNENLKKQAEKLLDNLSS